MNIAKYFQDRWRFLTQELPSLLRGERFVVGYGRSLSIDSASKDELKYSDLSVGLIVVGRATGRGATPRELMAAMEIADPLPVAYQDAIMAQMKAFTDVLNARLNDKCEFRLRDDIRAAAFYSLRALTRKIKHMEESRSKEC